MGEKGAGKGEESGESKGLKQQKAETAEMGGNSGKMIIAVKPARISKLRPPLYYQRRLFYGIALRNQATSLLQPSVWTARVTTSL